MNPGLKYTFLSLVVGWWGIPWGPIYTIASVAKNFAGGGDVTDAVCDALSEPEVGYDSSEESGVDV